ncbi:uncharacterized protein LOC117594840 isoform X3 [Esox lucius]|uniref:uncharacterized protein LOC117594840 isoform X3 n=1 Tax=Esox lucius TaxID=8010 RepID=UPI001476FFB5|nr:uncharacterized protein LOC117594840 isoform X3 [Esox lucius]
MRTTESVLVVVIWSLSGTMAIKCGQTSQVRVSPITPVWGQKVILTCNTPCNLTDNQNPTYIWYKNGQRLLNSTIWTFNDTSYYTHSYSCAVNGSENLRSPVVCVLGKTCFNVTYTHQRISALKGSTLDLPCTYQHPNNHTVIEMYWKKSSTNHTTDSADNRQRDSAPVYDNTSMPMASNAEQTMASNDQTDLHYASVHITRSRDQVVPLYSTAQLPPPQTQEEDVQYTAVKFNCPSAVTR